MGRFKDLQDKETEEKKSMWQRVSLIVEQMLNELITDLYQKKFSPTDINAKTALYFSTKNLLKHDMFFILEIVAGKRAIIISASSETTITVYAMNLETESLRDWKLSAISSIDTQMIEDFLVNKIYEANKFLT